MSRRGSIGFDRRIDLEWLDSAAMKAASGASVDEVRAHIWDLLDGAVSGHEHGSARQKTTTVLHHVWGKVPTCACSLRERALGSFPQATSDERLALHWAMMLGTYPVFSDSAAAIGRLLMLQGSFTLAHLTRRLVQAWGERSALERAGQRLVRSMVQWGVLKDTTTIGVYEVAPKRKKTGPVASMVLIEALLIDAEAASVSLSQLIGHPALFPFELEVSASQIRAAPQFSVHRQGLDVDILELREAP